LPKRVRALSKLGVPFYEPVAERVTIQAAAERACGTESRDGCFGAVREFALKLARRRTLVSYFNPILQYGLEKLTGEMLTAGADGILITDLIPEEAEDFREILAEKNLTLVMLAAPTSSDERLKKICDKASGFVYAVSRAGVTGARTEMSDDAETLVKRIRKYTDLPVAVGFGISNAEQIEEVCRYADAAVIGSAIVKEIERSNGSANAVQNVREFVRKLLPGKF
jgi:tryptophan synthase alpha chain